MANTGEMQYDQFATAAAENGLEGVTEEEHQKFVKGSKWSLKTALNIIRNARKGVKAKKDAEVLLGYLLGGRDFVYKGIDLEGSRSQMISFLTKGGELRELTQWGHLKGGEHGVLSEIEVVRSEKQKGDRLYVNHTIRAVTTHEDRIDKARLLRLARTPDSLGPADEYQPVILKGWIGSRVEQYPKFGKDADGVSDIIGSYRFAEGDQPILNFFLGPVRIGLGAGKFGKKLIEFPDLLEICRTFDADLIAQALYGKGAVVVGMVRKVKETPDGLGHYIDIEATAVFEIEADEMQLALDRGAPSEEATATNEAPDRESIPVKESMRAPLPADGVSAAVTNLVEKIHDAIKQTVALSGTDGLSVQALRQLYKGELEGVSDEVLEAAIVKRLADEAPPTPVSVEGEGEGEVEAAAAEIGAEKKGGKKGAE